jgi:hypothetical protein
LLRDRFEKYQHLTIEEQRMVKDSYRWFKELPEDRKQELKQQWKNMSPQERQKVKQQMKLMQKSKVSPGKAKGKGKDK